MAGDMTPGREALIEAMRLEQASIYGQTLTDWRERGDQAHELVEPAPATDAPARLDDDAVRYWRAQGKSVPEIALLTRKSRGRVAAVVHRVELAS